MIPITNPLIPQLVKEEPAWFGCLMLTLEAPDPHLAQQVLQEVADVLIWLITNTPDPEANPAIMRLIDIKPVDTVCRTTETRFLPTPVAEAV